MLDHPMMPDGYVVTDKTVINSNINRTLAAEAESFKWSEVRRGILELQVWLSATAYFAILCGLYSFGLFVSRLATLTT